MSYNMETQTLKMQQTQLKYSKLEKVEEWKVEHHNLRLRTYLNTWVPPRTI